MDAYDSIQYDSIAIPETHPERLAVLARLMGHPAADPATCRVLELGCAGGGNLIPIADSLPAATLLGIDLSPVQVAAGNRLIDEIGLANIRLRQGDIAALDPATDPDLAPFDYVIAHGVFSWVPPGVRERLLTLARRLLVPGGVFYVSWNVLPGWHRRGALRDCLLDACRDLSDPAERLRSAQSALSRLNAAVSDLPGEAARFTREEIRRLADAPASYLYFEYLAEHNHPMAFRAFAAECESAGLRYLCDSDLASAFPASLGDSVEQALADIEDGLDLEQWLDFAADRAFRQSLLIRDDSPADEQISLERFAAFSLAADLIPPEAPKPRDSRPARFTSPGGTSFEVMHPLTKTALGILCARYPDAVPLPELLHQAADRLAQPGADERAGDLESALAECFGLFAKGAILARLAPRLIDPALPGHPRASRLARAFVAAGRGDVPTRDHANLELDPIAGRLIRLLDGSRDTASLVEQLATALEEHPGAADTGKSRGRGERRGRGRRRGRNAPRSPHQRATGLLAMFRRYGVLTDEPDR